MGPSSNTDSNSDGPALSGTSSCPVMNRHRAYASVVTLLLAMTYLPLLLTDRGTYFGEVEVLRKLNKNDPNAGNHNSFATTMMERILATDTTEAGIQVIKAYKQLKSNVHQQEQNMIATFVTNLASPEGWPWTNFDWSAFPAQCGWHKCFWPSISNHTVGYLVARSDWELSVMTGGFELQQHLVRKFGILPVAMDPPISMRNTKSNIHGILQAYGNSFHQTDEFPVFFQKVNRVPQPNLFIGLELDKNMGMRLNIPIFAKQIAKYDIEIFQRQYRQEMKRLSAVLEDRPDLLNDFQLYVSTYGTFYHMDLERDQEYWQWHEDGTFDPDTHKKIDTREIEPAVVMETMGRILYWLTESNGNYSALHNELLFGQPYDEGYARNHDYVAPETITSTEHDEILISSILEYYQNLGPLSESQNKTVSMMCRAMEDREDLPLCWEEQVNKNGTKATKGAAKMQPYVL